MQRVVPSSVPSFGGWRDEGVVAGAALMVATGLFSRVSTTSSPEPRDRDVIGRAEFDKRVYEFYNQKLLAS
jgi:hypothetical protein